MTLEAVGLDGVALKPREVAFSRAHELGVGLVTVDYEGREFVPESAVLERLAGSFRTYATVPVRADGYDPLGEESLRRELPEAVREVLIAGNPAYLSEEERGRALAVRLSEAIEDSREPWVGTEGIERLALALGGTQYDLLSRDSTREVAALRTVGFEGALALYAPVVLTDDDDEILDAVGSYAARRGPVRAAVPADDAHDSTATGETRETLLRACREYALAGDRETVADRITALHEAGVDQVVGYPARGLDAVLG